MSPLLECVPNFSEGRDAGIVQGLVDAMSAVPGVACLAHELDADHHRAVITLAGSPDAVAEAAVRGARRAIETIDLRAHRGEHMRMGAMDVCPFVPLSGTTMDGAVAIARSVGERFGDELGLPVFFYGHAALRPERRVLGAVRNRGFEQLGALVESDPSYRPDRGPARLHPTAGAVGVGARGFLIAYNVQLASADVALAARISKAVRESSGGLPAVQARGFFLAERGLAQVSMNLLDYTQTPVRRVFDEVVALAAAEGVAVEDSELVGLVPRAALDDATARHVKLIGFDPGAQVLEERLRACGL